MSPGLEIFKVKYKWIISIKYQVYILKLFMFYLICHNCTVMQNPIETYKKENIVVNTLKRINLWKILPGIL